MRRRSARIVLVVALVAASAAAYSWWARPERQIRALLRDVAAALSSDPGESSLATLAGVAALEAHLADDISIQAADGVPIEGRDVAITAAARYRARNPVLVRFLDPAIMFEGDDAATVVVTAEVSTRSATAEGGVEVYQVRATLRRSEGRWLVSTAHASAGAPRPEGTRRHPGRDVVHSGERRLEP